MVFLLRTGSCPIPISQRSEPDVWLRLKNVRSVQSCGSRGVSACPPIGAASDGASAGKSKNRLTETIGEAPDAHKVFYTIFMSGDEKTIICICLAFIADLAKKCTKSIV
jgi:hypothetical protein